MDSQEMVGAPKDLLDRIEKMIRKISEEEQFELYKKLKTLVNDERRKSNRKLFFNEIVYTSSLGAHHEFTKDISEDGLFIETPIPLKIGEKLSITFPMKEQSEHIKLSGEIVRKTETGVGVKFHPIDRAKQTLLINLLKSL